ncbi:MAG TPA: amidase, partial [Pseudonocardia sp.]|jgi:amidase
MDELCDLTAGEIARRVRSRDLRAEDVMTAVAQRAERVNPAINALCTTDFDRALEEARRVDTAPARELPLLGVPVSIKDLTDTAGLRTTFGSTHYADRVPDKDALVVERIRAAGGIVFAKTNTPEFGAGFNTTNQLFGATRNPWDTSRSSGGSSGGAAAAVASGLGPIAHATDHGCSIRLPASLNGLVGLRPTPGRVPDWPSDWVYDTYCVTGPLARTVADCELFFQVMAGPDPRVPPSDMPAYERRPGDGVQRLRAGWSPDLGLAAVEPEVQQLCREAVGVLAEAGLFVEDACPDLSEARTIIDPLRTVRQVAESSYTAPLASVDNGFVTDYLQRADTYSARDVAVAEAARSRLWQSLTDFFESHDLLLTVTTQFPAFPVEQPYPPVIDGRPSADTNDACISCYAITVTGLPSLSVPAGWTADGLPVGLQIVAPRRREDLLFRVAAELELRRPWSHRRPPVLEQSSHG